MYSTFDKGLGGTVSRLLIGVCGGVMKRFVRISGTLSEGTGSQ